MPMMSVHRSMGAKHIYRKRIVGDGRLADESRQKTSDPRSFSSCDRLSIENDKSFVQYRLSTTPPLRKQIMQFISTIAGPFLPDDQRRTVLYLISSICLNGDRLIETDSASLMIFSWPFRASAFRSWAR